ncbi:MFS transporter [Comamonas piscis]|uniref:MFS transporter n=1 Tax=Comamonas piscis TaxID=1562974 RepID=A0A7G5EMF0_9BURK|nr:MFS transporter [Comamonas piscis]QMV75175.1 MFS transporter [Comamonas piscis]WSO33664.1 MFS transporter [Comamonas piscis]
MTSLTAEQGAAAAPANRPLNRDDYKTLGLSALGGTLEFYDFVVFVFFANVLGALFFPPSMPDWMRQLQTLGIFAAGYLARPIGGILIAHYGDILGRKKMFTLSVFLMAVPTLVIGLLPTYETIGLAAPFLLLAMRVLQGAAIGGEMPGAWVFVAEHAPAKRYGFAIGSLTSGITGGIFLGSIIGVWLNSVYSPAEIHDWAWRIPFILGGVFGLVSVYLRKFLHETPIFQEMQARKKVDRELPLKTILRDHREASVVVALMTWILSTAVVVVILFTPSYLQKVFHIAPAVALKANAVATVTLTIGCVFWGWLSDQWGTRAAMVLGWGGMAVTAYLFYLNLPGTELSLIWTYALVGFFVGAISLLPVVGVRAFPPEVRFTGLSFSYNMAYAVFGGLTPMLVSVWQQADVMAPAHYVAAMGVLGVAMGFWPLAVKGWVAKR